MIKREEVCCPTCKAPRANDDGTLNIVVASRDRNGNSRFRCKRCPRAESFVPEPPAAHDAADTAADDYDKDMDGVADDDEHMDMGMEAELEETVALLPAGTAPIKLQPVKAERRQQRRRLVRRLRPRRPRWRMQTFARSWGATLSTSQTRSSKTCSKTSPTLGAARQARRIFVSHRSCPIPST
jgi:hypothetical protein